MQEWLWASLLQRGRERERGDEDEGMITGKKGRVMERDIGIEGTVKHGGGSQCE